MEETYGVCCTGYSLFQVITVSKCLGAMRDFGQVLLLNYVSVIPELQLDDLSWPF